MVEKKNYKIVCDGEKCYKVPILSLMKDKLEKETRKASKVRKVRKSRKASKVRKVRKNRKASKVRKVRKSRKASKVRKSRKASKVRKVRKSRKVSKVRKVRKSRKASKVRKSRKASKVRKSRKASKVRKVRKASKVRKSRKLSSKGWAQLSPKGAERTEMCVKCGKKCFLGPDKSFPICNKGTCKINDKGVYAAYVRAKQWGGSSKKFKGRAKPRHSKETYTKIAKSASRKLKAKGYNIN